MYTHEQVYTYIQKLVHCFSLLVWLNYLIHKNFKWKKVISQIHFNIFQSLTILYIFSIYLFQFPSHLPYIPSNTSPSYLQVLFRLILVLEDWCHWRCIDIYFQAGSLGTSGQPLVPVVLLCHLCAHLPYLGSLCTGFSTSGTWEKWMLTLRETKSPGGFKLWVPFLQPQPWDSRHSGSWRGEN